MHRHRSEYPVEGEMPGFEGATAWLNSATADAGRRAAAESSSSASARTRASTGSGPSRTSRPGRRSTPVTDWRSSACRRPSSSSRGISTTSAARIEEMDVRYPVAVDNDYAVWQAFDNHYWPALYFVDAQGRIRHHHFGEGEYEESEMVLQMLLREAGRDVDQGLVRIEPDGVEAPADWSNLGSPETYLGYGRAVGFASPGGFVPDERSRLLGAGGAAPQRVGVVGRMAGRSRSRRSWARPAARSRSSSTPVICTS